MPRARNIKPSLFKNEILGVADPLLTLLFESLWCLADKAGRLEDRPLRIKAETFPYREGVNVDQMLTELYQLGFIIRYEFDEMRLIEVVNFAKHQKPHNTEKESELAAFSTSCPVTVKNPLRNALIPDSLNTDSLNTDSRNTVAKTTGDCVASIFEYWQKVHSRSRCKLDPKRHRKITAALKHFSEDDLKRAIDGAAKDDWLMGRDRASVRKYDDLLTILRDVPQIERMINLASDTEPRTKAGGYDPTKDLMSPEYQNSASLSFDQALNSPEVQGTGYEEKRAWWVENCKDRVHQIEEYERSDEYRRRFSEAGPAPDRDGLEGIWGDSIGTAQAALPVS